MNPCMECKNRYGREYSSECDDFCDYAKVCQENKFLQKQLKRQKLVNKQIWKQFHFWTNRLSRNKKHNENSE